VLNSNPVPEVDFILCRDMVSFMSGAEQSRILGDFREKLKDGGTVFMGAHERMPAADGWAPVEGAAVSAYRSED
jgi:chemotaxis methyl-accepting protein methylase